MSKQGLCSIIALCASACAPRAAATTLGYSHWFERYGPSSMGAFEQQQKRCLESIGAADDPAGVAPESSDERAYLECMSAAGWCAEAYPCR
jgi:hypothetical protein